MTTTCKNCNAPCTDKFCAACGQKTDTHAINFRSILHDIPHSILHIDKGLFFTIKELTIRPGAAIAEFIAGKRVNHFKPLAYVFILSAIASYVSHVKDSLYNIRTSNGFVSNMVAEFFDQHLSMMFFLFIPVFSLLSWMLHRKSGYNFWENIVLNTYIAGHLNLAILLMEIYWIITGEFNGSRIPLIAVFTFFHIWVFARFFNFKYNSLLSFLKSGLLLLLIAFVYANMLTFTGFMTPWWPRHQ